MPIPLLLSWSSGKDSAWALHILRQEPRYQVVGLITTLNSHFDRVAMHGTRRDVLEAQAAGVGLPLHIVPLPWPCSNAEYEAAMHQAIRIAAASGVQAMAFGDLYLEDVRRYREEMLQGTGLVPVFPLWGLETRTLYGTMMEAGLRARVVCLDPARVPRSFAGRAVDSTLLRDLPAGVDPCAENGEFHTCVYGGPMFSRPLRLQVGEIVDRDGFVFADLLLA